MAYNLIILGPQGSGKSTQADLLVRRTGMIHMEMGSILRSVAQEDSELGKYVNEVMNVRKELVSNELIEKILRYRLGKVGVDQGIILDGAPRKETQIETVDRVFKEYNRMIDRAIFVDIPEEVSVARIASRFACSQCGKAFILDEEARATHTLICDVCGGVLAQRTDDTLEGIRKRLAVFAAETVPVIEHYRAQGKLLHIDGTKNIEEIFEDIVKGLGI
ncbi:MAG: nucleoside monophosphate kinase [Hydrogenophilaceae bacterium]